MRIPFLRALTCLLVSVCSANSAALAQTLEATGQDTEGNPVVLAVQVSGEVAGATLVLTIEPGPMATKAIRIYSEPSHTLLVTVVDESFRASPAGEAWWQERGASKGAAVVTSLPAGRPAIQVPKRPVDDDRIAVWLKGLFPTETRGKFAEAEVLIADGTVGNGDFSFSTSFPLVPPLDDPEDPQHCCLSPSCGSCTNCKNAFFTCCLKSSFECGQCGKYQIECGSFICNLC